MFINNEHEDVTMTTMYETPDPDTISHQITIMKEFWVYHPLTDRHTSIRASLASLNRERRLSLYILTSEGANTFSHTP